MRDHIARLVCALSLAMVIALAAAFAWRHTPRSATPPPPHAGPTDAPAPIATVTSAAQLERGRTLFTELDCTTCHSFRGLGNPQRPLDASARQRSAVELAGWITGTGAPGLSPTVLKRKERYQDLSPEDLAALIAFLSAGTPAP